MLSYRTDLFHSRNCFDVLVSDYRTQIGKWYRLPRWARRAALQMKQHPLCKMCLERGEFTPATIADHIEPHKGDAFKFWYGKLQSLCTYHHSSLKAVIEHQGFSDEIGADGWPIDERHPVNKLKQ